MADRILIIDDDARLGAMVTDYLGESGFRASVRETAADGLALLRAEPFDAIVLDVMLPDLDGFEVARRLRQSEGAGTRVPVIFLTAKDTTADKVEGLRLGVDDYVTKPFSIEELIERVKAVLRRSSGAGPGESRLTYHDLVMDEETRDVWRAGRLIELTPTEFKLLYTLALDRGRVVTRDELLQKVWGRRETHRDRTVDVFVRRLRQKIDRPAPRHSFIQTRFGVGYKLEPEPK